MLNLSLDIQILQLMVLKEFWFGILTIHVSVLLLASLSESLKVLHRALTLILDHPHFFHQPLIFLQRIRQLGAPNTVTQLNEVLLTVLQLFTLKILIWTLVKHKLIVTMASLARVLLNVFNHFDLLISFVVNCDTILFTLLSFDSFQVCSCNTLVLILIFQQVRIRGVLEVVFEPLQKVQP